MISNRLSRWTLLFFACALTNFVVAQVLVVAGVTWPVQSFAAPGTLVTVHLLTIGWILLLMLGALFQFVPVITSKTLPSQNVALAALVVIELGLLGMICGFVAVGQGAMAFAHCLPVGGALVILGVLIAIGDIAVPLFRARPLPLPGRMVLTAFVFLLVTIGLGLLMALALTMPTQLPGLAPFLGAVGYHLFAGLGGWFTIAALGVSYKLLPMFMLAPEERGVVGECVHYGVTIGFAVVVIAGLAKLWYPVTWLHTVELVGYALVAASILLYLVDVVRLYRGRQRAFIELHNRVAMGAFAMLLLVTAVGIVLVATGTVVKNLPLLVFLILFGWLGGLGLTQLYKIVPFLTWIGRFGQSLGRGRVPRVQELVDERRGMPWFIVYFVGVALALPAFLGSGTGLFRIVMAVVIVATLLLIREYWRAWRSYYAAQGSTGSTTPPAFVRKEVTR